MFFSMKGEDEKEIFRKKKKKLVKNSK